MTDHTTTCPALFIAAPASGQGKTSLTAGLARYHRQQGRQVRVFKTGPDYLDPMILQKASGHPVYQLDLWLVGEQACQTLLYNAAREADLILIEGVMGLFDGEPSSADLSQQFGIPILAVINAAAMAQTFGAVALGITTFRPALDFVGVIANRVGSQRHAMLIQQSLPENIPFLGCLFRDQNLALPTRHLGLIQAEEIESLEAKLDSLASAIANTELTQLLPPVTFHKADPITYPTTHLQGLKIGIAKDTAFSFIYPANLDILRELGAELYFFSPLKDSQLPEFDSLWLPGGYPELHLAQLSQNSAIRSYLITHHQQNKPIFAECGGMLYLLDTLTDIDGQAAPMLGLLPGSAHMAHKTGCGGMQIAPLPEGDVRSRTFHHSRSEIALEPIAFGQRCSSDWPGEAIYRMKNITATYLHLYFPSNPQAIAALFRGNTV